MLAAEVQQGGVLTVSQSLPVGDDGRCGVRGQRASPELVVCVVVGSCIDGRFASHRGML